MWSSPQPVRNGNAVRDSNTDAHRDRIRNGNAVRDGNTDAHRDRHRDGNADRDLDADADADRSSGAGCLAEIRDFCREVGQEEQGKESNRGQ